MLKSVSPEVETRFYRQEYQALRAKVEATLNAAGFTPFKQIPGTRRPKDVPGYFIVPRNYGKALGVYHKIELNLIVPEIATSLVAENEIWIDRYYQALESLYTVYGEDPTDEISHCFLHVEPRR